ncbi:MAG TPA: hypothetical protein VFE55_10685 [Acidimicrobiia bacterium]|nr:hypothetical protein [Acidimicrobiia bacterium]
MPDMTADLSHLIAEVEISIVDTVDRLNDAETNLLYAEVLDVEQRLAALLNVLALVTEGISLSGTRR